MMLAEAVGAVSALRRGAARNVVGMNGPVNTVAVYIRVEVVGEGADRAEGQRYRRQEREGLEHLMPPRG